MHGQFRPKHLHHEVIRPKERRHRPQKAFDAKPPERILLGDVSSVGCPLVAVRQHRVGLYLVGEVRVVVSVHGGRGGGDRQVVDVGLVVGHELLGEEEGGVGGGSGDGPVSYVACAEGLV